MTVPADSIDRIMTVMAAAFDPAFGEAWTRRQIEDSLMLSRSHAGLIAPDGREPEGSDPTAGFFLSRTGVEEEELLLLAVMPEYRRQGLATALLRRFSDESRARGAKRLLLEMRRDNPAELLYRSHGFEPIGVRPNYYRVPGGALIDAVTFACDL